MRDQGKDNGNEGNGVALNGLEEVSGQEDKFAVSSMTQ